MNEVYLGIIKSLSNEIMYIVILQFIFIIYMMIVLHKSK